METNIVSMIQKRATAYGKREALRYRNKDNNNYIGISWDDLWNKSQCVARSLLSMGYGNGFKIGIMSENMPEWTIADIGILAARSIVVPFYAYSSNEQIKFIVEQTEMKIMFVGNQTQLNSALWALKNTKCLEKVIIFNSSIDFSDTRCTDWNTFINENSTSTSDEELNRSIEGIQPNDLATILYTSGTTGEPKGVMLAHDNFVQCFSIHDKRLNIDETDVSLCFLPLSHIFERTWTFYILYKGALNVYLESPKEVIDQIKNVKPTVMCTVPRFFEKTFDGIQNELQKWPALKRNLFNWAISVGGKVSDYRSNNLVPPIGIRLKKAIAEKLVLKKLRSLFGGNIRSFPCSGAAISNHHLRFFHAAGIFINYGYGATETTATVSCFRNDAYDLDSCGTIMPEVEIKISDSGEILVKGKTLFKGYYNNPEATEKAIVDGWYRTGDKGFLTSNGDLVMTDRINDIFKTSGGKYISPQKIELALLNDSFIDQVVVIGDNRKFVCALIVPSFEKFRAVWKIEGIDEYSNEELASHQRIINFMQNRIDHCQRDLPPFERIVKFKLLWEPYSIQNEGLTNTLKVRRKLIAQRYHNLIEEMYA
jgi:long-chain acyl-CoA synthetase